MADSTGLKDKTSLEWYARKLIPDEQIRKFKYRQDLLQKELEREAEFPEVKNVLSDIFLAVKDKDYKKFLFAHSQLKGRIDEVTLLQAIRYNILSKTTAMTKREAEVLQKLNEGKGLMGVF